MTDRTPPPPWFLDELAHAGRENRDSEHAAHYDEKEDADGAAEVALLQGLGLGPESVVVEFGPGTGQFTVEAATVCSRVIAVDVSEVMLAQLARKVNERVIRNVEIVNAGFLDYRHSGPAADFVYSRFALHHLPDFWKALALARTRRILKPGGILRLSDVVYDFGPFEAEQRINEWREQYQAEGGEGDWTRADVDEHVRDEHSTFTWILEAMIERTGFQIEDAVHGGGGVLSQYVLRALPSDRVDQSEW